MKMIIHTKNVMKNVQLVNIKEMKVITIVQNVLNIQMELIYIILYIIILDNV